MWMLALLLGFLVLYLPVKWLGSRLVDRVVEPLIDD